MALSTIQEKIRLLPNILTKLEDRIRDVELSKEGIKKVQANLDALEHSININKYSPTDQEHSNLWELQALIYYAEGNIKLAHKTITDIESRSSHTHYITAIAADIATDVKGSVSNTVPPQPVQDKKDQEAPHFFTIPGWQLFFLSIITFGFYLIYWAYKNWSAIEAIPRYNKKGKLIKVHPVFSAIFFGLTSFELYSHVRKSAEKLGVEPKISSGAYGVTILLLNLVSLSFIPVMASQKYLNSVKKAAFGDEEIRKKASGGEIVLIIFGILFMFLTLYGAATSDSGATLSPAIQEKKVRMDTLTDQYNTCSSALLNRQNTLDRYSQAAVDQYNSDYDSCEAVRLQQNTAVQEYNSLIQ